MQNKEYVTIQDFEIDSETVIDKSRFISAARHVDSAEQALEFINSKKKKYYDATHNCYAYIAGDKAKFSDDGEPQGTAGMPIYECIKNSGLDYVCVVVTRYFGGVKLGAGGLVRAYNGGCADVLNKCDKITVRKCIRAEVEIEYTFFNVMRKALSKACREENVIYDTKITIVCLFPYDLLSTITNIVSENTFGQGKINIKETLFCPY